MNSLTLLRQSLLALSLLAGVTAFAQGPAFGIKGGLTYSNLYANDVDDDNGRIGFNLGLMGRTDPTQPIGLQLELLYNTKGETYTYNSLLLDQETKLNTSYLDMPVLLSLRAGEALEVQLGGYAGLLLGSNVSTSGDLGDDTEELDNDNFKSVDYGLAGGLAFNAGRAQVGARYYYGLAEIADSDASEAVLGDAKHSFAQVYLGFGIGAR